MEDRLIDLETRIAFQEATLQQLNDVIAAHQQRIDWLERTCRDLASRVARQGDAVFKGTPEDEIPPHY